MGELYISFWLCNRWLWAPSVFMKLEKWERWNSIIGGTGTAFPCVQRHFSHWKGKGVLSKLSSGSNVRAVWEGFFQWSPQAKWWKYLVKTECILCKANNTNCVYSVDIFMIFYYKNKKHLHNANVLSEQSHLHLCRWRQHIADTAVQPQSLFFDDIADTDETTSASPTEKMTLLLHRRLYS